MIPLDAYAGTAKRLRRSRHAAACVRFAQSVPDLCGRLSLLDMAGRWLELAEQAEKTARSSAEGL
jgi:hypothetical protein